MSEVCKGKLIDWGFSQTKLGLDQLMCLFEFKNAAGQQKQMIWFGSFKSEKSTEITIKTLLTLGMKATDPTEIVDDQGIPVEGALDKTKEVNLTLETETDLEGKLKTKIAWVNSIGGNMMQNKTGKAALKSRLGNLTGFVASLRGPSSPAEMTQDDIPF